MNTTSEQLYSVFTGQLNQYTEFDHISLYNGRCGVLLYQALSLIVKEDEVMDRAMAANFQMIKTILNESSSIPDTFASGLAGFGWLSCYLSDIGFLEENDSFLAWLDETLEKSIIKHLAEDSVDIMHGAMGLGLYFLKRRRHSQVEMVIHHLWKTSKRNEQGTFWTRFDHYNIQGTVIDFGLAHGISGILYFLHKCSVAGIQSVICDQLISQGICFLHNNRQDMTASGSFFGTYILESEHPSQSPLYSRLAWCYGDLGILRTLYLINKSKKDKADIEELLLQTCTRRKEGQTLVSDISLCHGSSGAALLFYDLYHQTVNPKFLEAAYFWADESLAYYNKLSIPDADKSLLTGITGMGLMSIALQSPKLHQKRYSAWKEAFFLL